MTAPSAEHRYGQSSGLLAADMDGDLVMLSMERGDYYGVSGIGPFIWKLLETPKTVTELVAFICDEYEVDVDRARADVETFLSQLSDGGMVTVL